MAVHWKDWCWGWNSSTWPPDAKTWLIWKDPDAGKAWRQEEEGMTEDEMFRWSHWFNGNVFEQAPRVGDGQRSLASFSPWCCKESDMTERLNWTERNKAHHLDEIPAFHLLCSHCPTMTSELSRHSLFPGRMKESSLAYNFVVEKCRRYCLNLIIFFKKLEF